MARTPIQSRRLGVDWVDAARVTAGLAAGDGGIATLLATRARRNGDTRDHVTAACPRLGFLPGGLAQSPPAATLTRIDGNRDRKAWTQQSGERTGGRKGDPYWNALDDLGEISGRVVRR